MISSSSAAAAATKGGGGCPSIPSAYVALQQSLESRSSSSSSSSSHHDITNNNNNDNNNNDEGQNQHQQRQRQRALLLYKQLLRAAHRMPTPNCTNYILTKTRNEYCGHSKLTNEMEIEFQLQLADTNLDTVLVQAKHLTRLFRNPNYQNYNNKYY
jgi:hypothetical protein